MVIVRVLQPEHSVPVPCDRQETDGVAEIACGLIARYGAMAVLIAWGTADGYADEGDEPQYRRWIAIMDAVERIAPRHPAGSGMLAVIDTAKAG